MRNKNSIVFIVAAFGSAFLAPVDSFGQISGIAPGAINVFISGTPQVGQILTGNYTYVDTEGDLEGDSIFRWRRDNVYIAGATAETYFLVAADERALIRFEVTPVAQTGTSRGLATTSEPVGPVTLVPDPPTARSVSISGIPQVGQLLTGSYTYFDTEGDLEGASTFRWLRDDLRGNQIATGGTAKSYALVAADEGAGIRFEVTPVAQSGASPGLGTPSDRGGTRHPRAQRPPGGEQRVDFGLPPGGRGAQRQL